MNVGHDRTVAFRLAATHDTSGDHLLLELTDIMLSLADGAECAIEITINLMNVGGTGFHLERFSTCRPVVLDHSPLSTQELTEVVNSGWLGLLVL